MAHKILFEKLWIFAETEYKSSNWKILVGGNHRKKDRIKNLELKRVKGGKNFIAVARQTTLLKELTIYEYND